MAVRSILIHPDPRLKKLAAPVPAVDDSVRALIADMFDTMYAAPGIGLAAPQIGVSSRVIVMDCAGRDPEDRVAAARDDAEASAPDPIAMVNPEIVWRSEDGASGQEGCLSLPDMFEDVTRPAFVTVRWLDPEGRPQERRFGGIRAVCVQHEIDHLNGKLFIDYLGPVKRALITGKMKKLKRERAKDGPKDTERGSRPIDAR